MTAPQGVNYVFDASAHQPDAGMSAIPAGTYNVKVDGTEIKDMANDDSGQSKGWMLKVTFAVQDGPYAGSKFSNNYNLGHKTSPKNVEIAHAQLSALSHVTGIFKLDMNHAAAELRGAALKARVDNDGTYNSLKEVFDVNGNKPNKAGSGYSPSTPAVASAAPGGAWPSAAPAPVATVAAPAAPAAPVAPAAPAAFPPAGWTAHPTSPGYYYAGQEVLTEADLRAKFATPVAPAAPAAPAAPTAGAWPAAGAAPAPAAGAPQAPWGAR